MGDSLMIMRCAESVKYAPAKRVISIDALIYFDKGQQ
jgi:hypothetical protein